MTELLYLNASPRGDAAASTQAAELFLAALPGDVGVRRVDLFQTDLPDFTAELASAKQKFMMGMPLGDEESRQWAVVTQLVEEFVSADSYLLGVPMWNFSVPYRLKQYIDLVTHPGLTFARDANGMKGLAEGAGTVIYSRGGDYSPKDGQPDPFDFQSPYLKAWMGMVGINPVSEVLVQTTMAGPDAQAQSVNAVRSQLEALAGALGSGN